MILIVALEFVDDELMVLLELRGSSIWTLITILTILLSLLLWFLATDIIAKRILTVTESR